VVSGSEILVHNKAPVIDKAVVVDRAENVVVDIAVAAGDKHAALNFLFVFLALFLFVDSLGIIDHRALFLVMHSGLVLSGVLAILVRGLRLIIEINFFFLFFFVDLDVEVLKNDSLEVAVSVPCGDRCLIVAQLVLRSPGTIEVLVFVGVDFHEAMFRQERNTLLLKHLLHLLQKLLVFERGRVNVVELLSAVFVLVRVAVASGFRDYNVLVLNATLDQALDQSEDIQCEAINDTLHAPTAVGQLVKQVAVAAERVVKMRVVD
jgi:hypothetical protein